MKKKMKCWEFFECSETECPVYRSRELRCWLVSGTYCRDEIQGKFLEKIEMCLDCEPFKENIDIASLEETLKVVDEQFTEFRRMVEERDRELEGTSMELALGLSEVFEALKQISSGDPLVRIPETSDLELIQKLKHLVNLTAENLAEIVDLSHEFAIGLAEHFDALHRVSKGDLAARVSGISQVELLESLKKVTNEMIESVSKEITHRKRAEEALQRVHNELERRVEERTAELATTAEQLELELTERKRAEEEIFKRNTLLDAINRVIQETLTCETDEEVARTCLGVAEELTGSKFGFIGEVNEAGYFDTIALSDPGWDACRIPKTNAVVLLKNMEIRGIWGKVLKSEKSLIVNNPESHPDRCGTPEGHAPIHSFLGVPLTRTGRTIGMIGLANKELGYDLADQRDIETLSFTFVEALDRKRAEGALLGAKEDWENTFDAMTDMVMLLNSEHQIFRVNKAAAEALNTTKESLVGKKCYEAIHGRGRPIEACPLLRTVKTLKPHTTEITESNLGGTFICSTSPILNHEGKLTGYTHTLKDITESKRLEAQLQQAQRMEAIGTLAGGIAHDFNNVLMGIQGHASLVSLDTDIDHRHFEHLKGIDDMVQRGADLARQLLGFARGGKYEVKPTDVNGLIEKSSEMFGRTKKEIKIHTKHQKEIWPVEVDQAQIEQVLLNLYVNAWQAMPHGGDLYIETSNVELYENYTKPFGVEPGNYVKISVTDTGIGMDKAMQQRIFDPFFTTREMGRGTGLGLSSAYGIIKNHDGIINVYSEKGKGATFNIYLPASKKELPIREKRLPDEILKGTETVLLVDDEDMIVDVGEEMLKEMGYKVLVARSGKEAVELYGKHKDEVGLVILDMIMPEMSGGEAYDRMKENNPRVKVLLSSGYSIDGQATEILERGCDGFIQKPFNIKELSGRIREILDEK